MHDNNFSTLICAQFFFFFHDFTFSPSLLLSLSPSLAPYLPPPSSLPPSLPPSFFPSLPLTLYIYKFKLLSHASVKYVCS